MKLLKIKYKKNEEHNKLTSLNPQPINDGDEHTVT